MVKITVKTIKGDKFRIEVDQTKTVREAKGVIEATNAEFPAAQLKLIHSGKILKDESTLEEYQIKEDDFLVCMVTKPKPSAAPTPSATATSAPTAAAAAAAAAPAATPSQPVHAAYPSPAAGTAGVAAGRPATDRTGLNPEHVSQLTDMGFPEDQAVAALRAAMGNPDVAVEFLMTGIPDHTQAAPGPAAASATPATPGQTRPMETLDDFRGHPHFNDLKRLVQRDPAMLSHVLQVIGQQSPTLLSRIHENQGEFIALMNEPVDESIPPTPAPAPGGSAGGVGSMGAGGPPSNPALFAQMLQNLSPVQRNQMAAMMGVSPQQLAQVSQLISQMPPEQLQQMMGMFGAGAPGTGIGGMRGMPSGAAGTGGNVIRLTPEEGAAVARLSELGFDRTDAAQAYLACDKNEALAANLLMDGMGGMGMGTGVPRAFQAQPPSPAVPSTEGASVDSNPTAPNPTASTTANAEATNPPPAESGSVTGETVEGSAPTAQGAPPANLGDDTDGRAEGGDKDEDMYD